MMMRRHFLSALFLLFYSLPLFAQVQDDFLDGDLLNNPAWSGDLSKFTTNTSGQLQSSSSLANDVFYLSTPCNIAANYEWSVWIKLGFNPSSANYTDFFLMADGPILTNAINGYFVRVGNTTDEVSLYRLSGGTSVKIIDGADNTLASGTNNTLKIKVTRSASGEFTLFRNPGGTGNAYLNEGSVTDNTISGGTHCGLLIKQSTSSFFSKHFFDDLLIQPIPVDNTPPALLKAEMISPVQIDLMFNEPLDPLSAQSITTYNLSNLSAGIVSANLDAQNSSIVHLETGDSLQNGIAYLLQISGISDLAQNTPPLPLSSTLYMAKLFDVLINEIMADPDPQVGLPNVEYIEIKNNSSYPVRLLEYTLEAGSGSYTLPDTVLGPGTYSVLTAEGNASLFNAHVTEIAGMSSTLLTNTGTSIVLSNRFGDQLHAVTYSDNWYNDPSKSSGGWSLEMIDPGKPCAGSGNWKAASNVFGGTPGQINSVYGNQPDNLAPFISSVSLLSLTRLQVNFSEPVYTPGLLQAGNYQIQPGNINTGVVSSPAIISNFVLIDLANPLMQELVYTLTLSTPVSDCSGNNSGNLQSPAFSAYRPQLFEIVINEIMADPDPAIGLPSTEYLELFNRTNFPIDLTGFTLKLGSSSKDILSGTIPANGYAMILKSGVSALLGSSLKYIDVDGLSSSFLTNSGTTIELRDTLNQLVSILTYSDTWYKDPGKVDGGWSMEQIDPSNPCGGISNWRASQNPDGGTPGYVNSVNAPNPDNSSPKVSDVCANGSQLLVVFSEPVLASALLNTGDYSVNNAIGNPSAISTGGGNIITEASLVFSTAFNAEDVYTLTFNQVFSDCKGNISAQNANFSFSNRIPKAFDIVINEIMADPDPSVDLPSAEYVELFNRSNVPFSLNQFVFTYGSYNTVIGCRSIAAGDYLLLCDADNASQLSTLGKTAGLASFSITNSGTALSLNTPNGDPISFVNFLDSWYGNTLKSEGGWSLEQRDPDNPCAGSENWKASNDLHGGTPGVRNSVFIANPDKMPPQALRAYPLSQHLVRLSFSEPLYPSLQASWFSGDNELGQAIQAVALGPEYTQAVLTFSGTIEKGKIYTLTIQSSIKDCAGNNMQGTQELRLGVPEMVFGGEIIFTEMMNDPVGGGYDYVEIYNASTNITDAKYFRISSYDTLTGAYNSTYSIDTSGFLLFPGEYYVLTENPDWVKKNYRVNHPENIIRCMSLPSFNIEWGTCALSKWNDSLLDRMQYHQDMHVPWLSNTKGVSLEKIVLQLSGTTYSNWSSASQVAGFGTPTDKNSQSMENPVARGNITLSADYVSPDNDGYQDQVIITYQLDKPGYQGKCFIVDTKGRNIKTLINNLSLGSGGELIWNGETDQASKAEIGIYLVVMELFHADGSSINLRKPLVVAGKL